MNKKPLLYCTIPVLVLLASCTGFSKYGIDEKPSVEINKNFLGIWKSAQDTNKAGYLVLTSYDKALHHPIGEAKKIEDYFKKYPELKDMPHSDELYNEAPYTYYAGYINVDNKQNTHRNFNTYMSIVAGDTFLNIPYWDTKDRSNFKDDDRGFIFVRFLRLSKDRMSIAVVSDPSMKDLSSSATVREKIEKNLNNKNFYKDTINFYKVKSGDFDLEETVKLHESGQLKH